MRKSSIKPHRVLFVCLGNICRSPAAEIILNHLAEKAGRAGDFEIDSAGTIGLHQGAPPDERMSNTLRRKGYTIRGHSRKIVTADLANFDQIITMDESNLEHVRSLDPSGGHHPKIRPFVEFCSTHDDPRVPDPYYGGQLGFDHVIRLLEDGCQGILNEITLNE
jgi:protein-tyrosine phosphatase